MNRRGAATGSIFFIVIVVIAIALFMFARGENTSPYAIGSDTNASLFVPFDLNIPTAPPVTVNAVEAYFCPQDACADQLVKHIDGAQKSVYIAIYSFTQDDIANAVIRAKQRGVEVRIIFDYDQSKNASSDDERIAAAGIPIARRNGSGYMHNKFTIIDGNVTATGSFNYSNNANEKNDENLVFIVSEAIAAKFKADFDHVWSMSDTSS